MLVLEHEFMLLETNTEVREPIVGAERFEIQLLELENEFMLLETSTKIREPIIGAEWLEIQLLVLRGWRDPIVGAGE